ncbi:hypothetical protein LCGC14_0231440 [marine sediment metagenome]|uniref:Uncharacterized protein n=1 Tax=marine sediment metagenome TaxID=412755 RepID=A0A0F9URA4_9ZZZZ
MQIYIFFRLFEGKERFYPIEVPDEVLIGRTPEEVARDNAELNPGTIRVEDFEGNILWALH